MAQFSSLQAVQAHVPAAAEAAKRAEQHLQLLRESARQDVAKFEVCRSSPALPRGVPLPDASARHERRQFVRTLKQALETWRVNGAALDDLNQLLPSLERTLKVVEEERRRFTDDLLTSVASEVSRLYEAVHLGEGQTGIRLELDPKKRASLEIGASFCGQASRPQGYFSESHLDTLGLCVFIALAALDQPEETILVLDDVLSSVDDNHSGRLLNLLKIESQRFRHCILTTHKRPMNEAIENIQFIELAPWSLRTGLQTSAIAGNDVRPGPR